MNAGDRCMNYMTAKVRMSHLKIHASETAWVGGNIDYTINNDSTIDNLFDQIKGLLPTGELSDDVKIVLDII
jgi:hypothetical protein